MGILGLGVVASAFEVSRKDNRLWMQGKDCSELRTEVGALNQWMENGRLPGRCEVMTRDGKSSIYSPDAKDCPPVDISACVPPLVNEVHGYRPKNEGPNCWNLCLVMQHVLPGLRYTTPQEMTFFLQSPLCRKLDATENKRPGDIGAIREDDGGVLDEVHGFIYLSETMVYSKNGYRNNTAFKLQSSDGVYDHYGVPDRPECRGNVLDPRAKCKLASEFFRCKSMAEYLESTPDVPDTILKAFDRLNCVECNVQGNALRGSVMKPENRDMLADVGKILTVYLKQEKEEARKTGFGDEDQAFVLGAIQLRLQAAAAQMRYDNQEEMAGQLSDLKRWLTREVRGMHDRNVTPVPAPLPSNSGR